MNCSPNDKSRARSYLPSAHTCLTVEPARNTCATAHLLNDSRMRRKHEGIEYARLTSLPRREIRSMTSILATTTFVLLMSMHGIEGQPDRWYGFPRRFSMNSFASIDVMASRPSVADSSQVSSTMDVYPHAARYARSRFPEEVDYSKNMHDEGSREMTEEETQERAGPSSLEEIERVVEKAMKDGHLLDPQKWAELNDGQERNRNVPRDTSLYQDNRRTGLRSPRGEKTYYEEPDTHHTLSSDSMQSDGKIVFPDEREGVRRQSTKVKEGAVPVCKGSTFCETPSYYPEDLVSDAVRRDNKLRYLASVDVVTDVVQRIDVTDDVPLCVSTEQVVYPKTAENRNKEWHFIVNQDNFTQGVRIETCAVEDNPCRMYDSIPAGYKSSCKQKYIYRQLAAIVDGSVAPDMFRFPSSCCCHIKFLGNPLARMGFSSAQEQTPAVRNGRNK